ncbi:hypothetical protein ACFLS9_01005 [Bacteroidota bacterium]
MKDKLCVSCILTMFLLLTITACNSKKSDEQVGETVSIIKSDEETMNKLKVFLNIPVYPGAKLAFISTGKRDDKIPDVRMDASVNLIIDDYNKVPLFSKKELKKEFEVDIENDKKYYTLKFEKEGWEHEIFVGHDTFINQPIYYISMWAEGE